MRVREGLILYGIYKRVSIFGIWFGFWELGWTGTLLAVVIKYWTYTKVVSRLKMYCTLPISTRRRLISGPW